MKGPLRGLRVIEMAGIGPAPFCAMMLADMGAEILRIQRPQPEASAPRESRQSDVMARGRRSLTIDLHAPGGAARVLDLLDSADILIEGFRPGVMERLGLGPDICLARRPGLIYGRMTGWGQSGPLSACAGHDVNYIALSGALHAIGRPDQGPTLPLNYIGDFGGGGMMLAFGIVCAVLEARQSGQGQVVDAAMSDGAALLSSMMYGMHADGKWSNQRGDNLLDGGAHFYNTYACADGKHIAIGAIEPQFYRLLLERCGIDEQDQPAQMDTGKWPELKRRFADLFRTRTRQEWCALLEATDACFAPVLDWDEAPQHPHNQARQTFVTIDGVVQPAPAPRFSRTPPAMPASAQALAADACTVVLEWKRGAADHGNGGGSPAPAC
ncbi:E-cinnamoyl-CoA:R-phenyllactate CoA transferase [mine drainage metagenome]|uniref:E-cinnamoyl-CoA:R-phenyllactate CoA transferase n=1 Tax=mine drainage metagenome TaxID=410659 RepID=A0A1J5S3E5_9ZZZZ